MDMVEEDRTAHLAPPYIQRMAGIRMQQTGMGMGGYFMPTMPRFFIPAQIHAQPCWSQQQAVPRPGGMPGMGKGRMGMRGGVGPWGPCLRGPRVGPQLPRPMNQPGPQPGGVGPWRPRVGGTRFEQQLQLPMNQPVPQPGGVGPQGPSVGGPRGGQQVPKPMIQTGPQPMTMMTRPGMSQVPMVGVQVTFLLIITHPCKSDMAKEKANVEQVHPQQRLKNTPTACNPQAQVQRV